ncbi:hypothetical protein Tco_1153640 [Tanacetum coccineum]
MTYLTSAAKVAGKKILISEATFELTYSLRMKMEFELLSLASYLGFVLPRYCLTRQGAQGSPTQSAAHSQRTASVQGTASFHGTANSQRTAEIQGTADFQGTAEPHDAASIPKSPNDYTPTDAFQTSGGDEGLLDIYALNREVKRLKRQTLSQAKQIIKLKTKLKKLSNFVQPVIKHHAFWVENQNLKKQKKRRKKHKKKVSSVKLGRNKDEGTLSEEHYVQEEDTADPFFDDIADKDAAITPDLERKNQDVEHILCPIQTQHSTAHLEGTDPKDKGKGILEVARKIQAELDSEKKEREQPSKKPKLRTETIDELRNYLRVVDFEKNAQDRESLEGISMITELQVIDSPDGEQDLYHLYRVVDDYYEHIPPTGLGLMLLGDLTIIWETAAVIKDDDFLEDQEEWEIIRGRVEDEDARTWQGHRRSRLTSPEQTATGKQLVDVSVPLDHFPVNTLTSKVFSFMVKKGKHFSGKVTPLFATMLVQPTQDEGASSERPSEAQPTPSPAPTSEVPYEPQTDSSPAQTSEVPIEHQPNPSPRPSPTTTIPASIPETSGENLGGHSSSDKSLSGNEGDMTIQGVYDLCLSLCKQVSDQAKEIQDLKAQITKLKKQAKPVIKHHKAYLKSVSLKQRFPRKSFSKKHRVHKESVSKQGRKFAKGESSVQRDPLFDGMPEDTVDHMETENAQDEGRTREIVDEDKEIDEVRLSTEDEVSTVKEGVSTDFEKVSTDRPIVSTDGSKVSTDRPIEGTEEQVKGTDELKEGTEEHNGSTVEQREGTEEKPLPKIDPKDKGKKKIEEEDESESESDGIPEAEKKFKQLEGTEEDGLENTRRVGS